MTVSVSLGGDSKISVGSSGVRLGTLPAAYRPASDQVTAASGKGSGLGQLTVTSAGVVWVWNFGSGGVYFGGIIVYPL
ncbi:MAG: hypothetical protein GX481_09105 [Atopobium sp.]|nr:hypothetical protein [Atopobium sp.]